MPGIEYELIRTSRKTICITVAQDASVVVRAPLRAPKAEIARFVAEKSAWITEKQALMRRRSELHKPVEPASGEEFPYLGRRLMLAASDSAQRVEATGETLAFPRARLSDARALLKRWYVCEAGRVITERVNYWMGRTGIFASSLGITDARKRWGSCGAGGRLNFTWRLVTAPPDVIDYVVVHELSHIRHMNHSREFWACVAGILPDYQEKKKWLKENNALLQLF